MFDNSDLTNYTEIRTCVRFNMKGELSMTANEIELINLIRENENPNQALTTAAEIILIYLKQHESSEGQAAACLQALA